MNRPGWNLRLGDEAALDIAKALTSGDDVYQIQAALPRNVFEDEYGKRKIASMRVQVLVDVDEKGYFPAAPLETKIIRTSWKYGNSGDMPEDSDWDTALVYIRCRVWKL